MLLPARDAAAVWRLATGTFPVLIAGEPGTGRRRVARALHHTACPDAPFVVIRGASGAADLRGPLATLDPETPRATVYVESIEELDPAGQDCLLMMIDEGAERRGAERLPLWFILATTADLRGLAERGQFLRELYHRVSTLALQLPPLRARRDDIPALVEQLSEDVVALLPVAHVRYSERALEELCSYAWPGNIHELEAVVRRTVVMQRKELIDADDLLFDPMIVPAESAAAPPPGGGPVSRPAPLPHVLEYLLTELAHELKNPMVTIKTFAQHLDDLFGDAEARAHFRLLTEDAITRMDGLLENLLEFSRLPAPQPSLLELAPLVHEALETIRSDLVAKHVEIRLSIENGRVCADETHLRYALRNILRGVAEEIPPRTWLSVDLDAGGPLRLALPPPRGLAHRLATLISGDRGRKGTGAAPLGFVLAHSVVASNGGHVRIDTPDEGQMDVTITLPAAV